MGFYDIHVHNNHSIFFSKLLIFFNTQIIHTLLKHFPQKKLRVLEIGPGKGYFFHAIKKFDTIFYTACDTNKRALSELGCKDTLCTDVTKKFPSSTHKYDIVYAAYVIEHFQNGKEIFTFINNCTRVTKKGGLIVFLAPEAMSQKMEFWNIDYTHAFPTTKRNVMMAFCDCGLNNLSIVPINGLITCPYFDHKLVYIGIRLLFSLYHYRIFSNLFLRSPHNTLNNIFYRIFVFAQSQNFMIIAKV